MPSITCDKVVLDNLYYGKEHKISESVVTIRRYKGSRFVNFGTGFIIHSTRSEELVCTSRLVLRKGEAVFVCYSDGTSRQASEFIKDSKYGLAVLSVSLQPGQHRRSSVLFSKEKVKREEICTVARVDHDGDLGIMSGIVVAPDGKTMLPSGLVSTRTEHLFALTCPYGRKGDWNVVENLLGAAVFTLRGSVVGAIKSVSDNCYDLKFATHTTSFLDELNRMIDNKLKKISHSRDAKDSQVLRVDSKRKRSHEGQIPAKKHVKYAAKEKTMEDWCLGSAW